MKTQLLVAMLAFTQLVMAGEADESKLSGDTSTMATETVRVDEKILRTNAALKSYRETYVNLPHNKAFAQSPEGHWNFRSDRVTPEIAKEDALAACNKHVRKKEQPCAIVNINGEWVEPRQ